MENLLASEKGLGSLVGSGEGTGVLANPRCGHTLGGRLSAATLSRGGTPWPSEGASGGEGASPPGRTGVTSCRRRPWSV